jgi:hypothetical protein
MSAAHLALLKLLRKTRLARVLRFQVKLQRNYSGSMSWPKALMIVSATQQDFWSSSIATLRTITINSSRVG